MVEIFGLYCAFGWQFISFDCWVVLKYLQLIR